MINTFIDMAPRVLTLVPLFCRHLEINSLVFALLSKPDSV